MLLVLKIFALLLPVHQCHCRIGSHNKITSLTRHSPYKVSKRITNNLSAMKTKKGGNCHLFTNRVPTPLTTFSPFVPANKTYAIG